MMWWNHGFWGSGWGWSVVAIMAVAMFACMAMMGRMMMRHGTSRPTWQTSSRDEETPEQILARRLASGQIDVEEFERLREALHPASTSPGDAAEPSGAVRRSPAVLARPCALREGGPMSPSTSARPAWLTVPPADGLPDAVAAEIGPVAGKIGFVPNVAWLLAISPEHFTGWWRYFDELMRGTSGLSKTQRVARLREAGFTDADIMHIVEITAIFNYNVRLAAVTGLFPNPEYHTLGRAATREG